MLYGEMEKQMESDKLFKRMNLQFFAEDGDQDQDTGNEQDDNENKEDKPEVKTFTQEEVNSMMAREKNQGKRSILKDLGFTDEKSARIAIQNYQKFLNSQKSEEDLQKENDAKAERERTEVQERADKAEAKVEALIAGVKPEMLDDIITLAMSRKTDDKEFKDVLTEMKTKYPAFFTSVEKEDKNDKDEKKPGERGTGRNVKDDSKNKSNQDEKKLSLGERLAAQRKATQKKSTYNHN
jgi:hypothetical protein